MTNKKEYVPINCSYYDFLEAHATIGDLVKIKITTEMDGEQTITDRLMNFVTRKGEEFVLLESGNVYRLDAIVSINGKTPNQPH